MASEQDWGAEVFEVRPDGDLRLQIAEALRPMAREISRKWRNKERAARIGRIVASFAKAAASTVTQLPLDWGEEPERGVADSGALDTDLSEFFLALGEAAQQEGVGAALLIDEMQEAEPRQLAAVISAVHRVNQEQLPIVVGGAGLPPIARILSDARLYSERLFHIHPVERLNADDSALALSEPAHQQGVLYTPDALAALVEASGGYPFFIQTYGKHAWDRASKTPVNASDVEIAIPQAYSELCESFFRPRYERARPSERSYLHAMAKIGGDDPAPTRDVAPEAGYQDQGAASQTRDSLINKGLIYAPERGYVAFTVPSMAPYLANLPGSET